MKTLKGNADLLPHHFNDEDVIVALLYRTGRMRIPEEAIVKACGEGAELVWVFRPFSLDKARKCTRLSILLQHWVSSDVLIRIGRDFVAKNLDRAWWRGKYVRFTPAQQEAIDILAEKIRAESRPL